MWLRCRSWHPLLAPRSWHARRHGHFCTSEVLLMGTLVWRHRRVSYRLKTRSISRRASAAAVYCAQITPSAVPAGRDAVVAVVHLHMPGLGAIVAQALHIAPYSVLSCCRGSSEDRWGYHDIFRAQSKCGPWVILPVPRCGCNFLVVSYVVTSLLSCARVSNSWRILVANYCRSFSTLVPVVSGTLHHRPNV